MNRADLYLKLLPKSPINTLYEQKPDHDSVDSARIVAALAMRCCRDAIALSPRVRHGNTRSSVKTNLAHEAIGGLIEAGVWLDSAMCGSRGIVT